MIYIFLAIYEQIFVKAHLAEFYEQMPSSFIRVRFLTNLYLLIAATKLKTIEQECQKLMVLIFITTIKHLNICL